MQNRLTSLSFIIGLFFSIVSLILLVGYLAGDALKAKINLYSGVIFLVFGIFMMMSGRENRDSA